MGSFKLTIIPAGFNETRNDPRIQDDLHARGDRIAEAAGGSPDFEVIDAPNETRARVVVKTSTKKGRHLEATERALTRALDAGRG